MTEIETSQELTPAIAQVVKTYGTEANAALIQYLRDCEAVDLDDQLAALTAISTLADGMAASKAEAYRKNAAS